MDCEQAGTFQFWPAVQKEQVLRRTGNMMSLKERAAMSRFATALREFIYVTDERNGKKFALEV
jgi:hypothetical protein